MNYRRAFITGAGGFIGRALSGRLQSSGVETCGVDLLADGRANVVPGDIRHPGEWQQAMVSSDLVIHTAAIVSNAVGIEGQWESNVLGTRNVLDAASAAGVGRLIHFSSVRAFSDLGFPGGVTEKHPVRPDGNPYVDTKIASEQVALQSHAAGEIEVTIVRPGDVYGPGSRPWTVLPMEAIRSNRFALPAMGRGIITPTFIENLVDGVLLAARTPGAAGQIYTLSDGAGVTCKEFFGHYCRMLGKRGPICLPTPLALASARATQLAARLNGEATELNPASALYLTRRGTYSIEKARRELGYEPAVDLEEGMRRTEAWLRRESLI